MTYQKDQQVKISYDGEILTGTIAEIRSASLGGSPGDTNYLIDLPTHKTMVWRDEKMLDTFNPPKESV